MAIPDWVKGFYTITKRYEEVALGRGWLPPKHTVDSKYCKVQEITPGATYRLMFEDRDLEFVQKLGGPSWSWPAPDFDYDEPVLLVERVDDLVRVTVERYGGRLSCDVYYKDQKILEGVGGPFGMHVGETVQFTIPEEITEEEKPQVVEAGFGLGTLFLIGLIIYALTGGGK